MKMFCLTLLTVLLAFPLMAQDIRLPEPQKSGGKPICDTLSERQTNRNVSPEELELQTVSDILWAAYGFNREDRRVIPTANNKQELTVYAVLKDGIYLYDAKSHTLQLAAQGDHRVIAAGQDFANNAPLNLLYVVDFAKGTTQVQSGIACGAAAQNVYLVCASKELACVVRTTLDKDALSKVLRLSDKQEVLLGQTVGKVAD